MKYDERHQLKALNLFMGGMSKSKISRQHGMPTRQQIINWAKAGLPVEVTGGLNWDEYKKKTEKFELIEYQENRATQLRENNLDFIEQSRQDIKDIMDTLVIQLKAGDAEPRYSDLKELMQLYIRIDNQAADQISLMRTFSKKVLQIVAKHVTDERLRDLIRMEFNDLMVNEKEKMGDIPRAAEHLNMELTKDDEGVVDAVYVEVESSGPVPPVPSSSSEV